MYISNHIQSSNEGESSKTVSKSQDDNSSECESDIEIIENPSTDIDEVKLSNSCKGMSK